jgi:hypothetical protein
MTLRFQPLSTCRKVLLVGLGLLALLSPIAFGLVQLPEATVAGQSNQGLSDKPLSVKVLTDATGVNITDWLARWNHETETAWRSTIPKDIGSRKPGAVVIRMKVSPIGHIVDGSIVLEERSGDAVLDGAAWKALATSKYPPMPSDFHGPYLELRATFRYKLVGPQ